MVPLCFQKIFVLKQDYIMKILWDDCAFITPSGITQRIVKNIDDHHEILRLRDTYLPQNPSIIAKNSMISNSLIRLSFSKILFACFLV